MKFNSFYIKNSTKQGFQFLFLKIVFIFQLNVFSKRKYKKYKSHYYFFRKYFLK